MGVHVFSEVFRLKILPLASPTGLALLCLSKSSWGAEAGFSLHCGSAPGFASVQWLEGTERTGIPGFLVGYEEEHMKQVWTLLSPISIRSANHHVPSPLLSFHHLSSSITLTYILPGVLLPICPVAFPSLTILSDFLPCASEHFHSLLFHWFVGSLLRAEYHPGKMILVDNY